MDEITAETFESEADRFDEAVGSSGDVDRFCSSTPWILPAWRAFHADGELRAFRGDHGRAAFVRSPAEDGGRVLHALECTWGFACPVPALRADEHAADVALLFRELEGSWDAALLSGLRLGSSLFRALVAALSEHHALGLLERACRRLVVDLGEGVDAWLGRRSSGFRRSQRRAASRAATAGLRVELATAATVQEAEMLHDRTLAVERRSWKGRQGVGVDQPPMSGFYRDVARRLARRAALRAAFAVHDGRDVAYVVGGVLEDRFRGLQLSFDAEAAGLSPANLAQVALMRELAAGGVVTYDMGMDAGYKHRWADRAEDTVTLVVRPVA